jgi:glycosyltransferase involved in cell wall biosynthesis
MSPTEEGAVPRLHHTRVRLYETVRTAHLERAHRLVPAAIVYRGRRYDFAEDAAAGLELVQASRRRAAALVAGSDVNELEVNEPLMLSSLPTTALVLAALRLRRRSPRVVTYAIGNADPFTMPPRRGLRSRLRARLDLMLARSVWHRLDRVAYGTDDARAVYERVLGAPRRATTTLIPALPARRADVPTASRGRTVVFLGAFVERKGLPELVAAWPLVTALVPGARLVIAGKGRLEDVARALAAQDASVEVVVDPPRDEIRRRLATSRVLVLASQPTPAWREQVGLPIVEGLEQGCRVVATTETGLSGWLAAHGHAVVAVPTDPADLAAAIVDQLKTPDDPSAVLATLPRLDGRLEADRWLFWQE